MSPSELLNGSICQASAAGTSCRELPRFSDQAARRRRQTSSHSCLFRGLKCHQYSSTMVSAACHIQGATGTPFDHVSARGNDAYRGRVRFFPGITDRGGRISVSNRTRHKVRASSHKSAIRVLGRFSRSSPSAISCTSCWITSIRSMRPSTLVWQVTINGPGSLRRNSGSHCRSLVRDEPAGWVRLIPRARKPAHRDSTYHDRVVRVSAERFEELASQVIEDLPEWVAPRMDNVHVAVEDRPPADQPGLLGWRRVPSSSSTGGSPPSSRRRSVTV